MENPIGLGGITLLVAAVVWLAIFVPGFSKRSEIRATNNLVRKDAKQHRVSPQMTADEQLTRLINTQRGFSVLFALFFLGALAAGIASVTDGGWLMAAGAAIVMSALALFVSRAAGRRATELARSKHAARNQARAQAFVRRPAPVSREWEPNPIPAPLNQLRQGELNDNLAEVVEIKRDQKVWAAKDLDAILARRRAI